MTIVSGHIDYAEVAHDAQLAMTLAAGRSTGEVADALRDRLRGHIDTLADQADSYAHTLPDDRARDIARETVRHARTVAADRSRFQESAASLRLLAKAAEFMARYASHAFQADP